MDIEYVQPVKTRAKLVKYDLLELYGQLDKRQSTHEFTRLLGILCISQCK